MLSNAMFPIGGVWITPAKNPDGFLVGRYDTQGFVSGPRWFETIEKARAYARTI